MPRTTDTEKIRLIKQMITDFYGVAPDACNGKGGKREKSDMGPAEQPDLQRDPAKGGMKVGICLLYIALGTMFIVLCGSGYGAWAGAVMIMAGCFLALHIDTRNERKFDMLEKRISELEGRVQSGEGKVPR